jgi:hypothetical protein
LSISTFVLVFNLFSLVLQLEEIQLSRNQISSIGAFVEPLRANESIRMLNFGWNVLTDADAQVLVQVLKQSKSLTDLTVKGNALSAESCAALQSAVEQNPRIVNFVAAVPPPVLPVTEPEVAMPTSTDSRPVSATHSVSQTEVADGAEAAESAAESSTTEASNQLNQSVADATPAVECAENQAETAT